ncbi:hypothetical protein [Allokutzneria albata]|nr:hypothetical protein [Allokutzneria albata]
MRRQLVIAQRAHADAVRRLAAATAERDHLRAQPTVVVQLCDAHALAVSD